jgi:hypothetical protein
MSVTAWDLMLTFAVGFVVTFAACELTDWLADRRERRKGKD